MSSPIENIINDSMIADCADAAREYFSSLFCAESVLLAVARAHGIESDLIPRVATGFCSGMGRTGGLCGAVAGGIMAISLIHGRDTGDDGVDETYARVVALRRLVQQKWGTISCYALTGCDFTTQEGQERFRQGGVKVNTCFELARDCAGAALWLTRNDLATIREIVDTTAELL